MEQNPAYKHSYISAYSSVVEHGIADPMVAGSIPVTPSKKKDQLLVSPVG